MSNNTLFGTTGGVLDSLYGTVYKINSDGTSFSNLYTFSATSTSPPYDSNSDGAYPHAGLVLAGNTLYGTASGGGTSGNGTVFRVNTDGTGFTNLHSFSAASAPYYTNGDGAYPNAALVLSGDTLYGTAAGGGSSGFGTVFALKTNGTGFMNLHSFSEPSGSSLTNSDGASPNSELVFSGNVLYGTATYGGTSGNGTVFSLSLPAPPAPPHLSIIRTGTNLVLRWPTNSGGFMLQSTTNLVAPIVWITNSPGPTVVNGQNTVTNVSSSVRKFYRLSF